MTDLAERFYLGQKELNSIKTIENDSKIIFQAANIIRKEIKKMKDTMPWPPQACDLQEEAIKLGPHLSKFMNAVLSGKMTDTNSQRKSRLKMSLGQDMIFAVSNGRVKTPKSILYPYTIKTLTNCTELIIIIIIFDLTSICHASMG